MVTRWWQLNDFLHFHPENWETISNLTSIFFRWVFPPSTRLADAAQVFRISKLPREGKKLYMQMIDTAFKNFTATVVPWFHKTFSDTERSSWVVADQHWYVAWDSQCDIRTDEGGAIACDAPLEIIRLSGQLAHD